MTTAKENKQIFCIYAKFIFVKNYSHKTVQTDANTAERTIFAGTQPLRTTVDGTNFITCALHTNPLL